MASIRYILIIFLCFSLFSYSQTGPGGVGTNDGTSNLKIWYATSNGVNTTGTSIDNIVNSAGISALNISETSTRRPTLVSSVVNGYDEISFSGTNRLRTGLNLTTSNFITNQASSFVVCRADNTSQRSCVYTTDPLVGNTRFANHIPWNGTVYFDIGNCCGSSARIQVGGLSGLTNYSYWSYDANSSSGKQLYRNGSLLQNRANTTTYNSHSSQRFNIGGYTSGTQGFVGDVTEIIIFNQKINTAQRIIIENYLSAKYNITASANDLYIQDNSANGDYDHDVAGIGRIDASNIHNDSQGTGIVRILNPTGLGNNEFLLWGHDNGIQQATNITDIPSSMQARFDRVWRVSEVNTSGTAIDVGAIDIRWDLTGLGSVTASDLRLIIDTDNDGIFSDETPISGATSLGGNIYQFANITSIANNLRFTLGTINISQTPLPIELINFKLTNFNNESIKIEWQTASEINNDFFNIEKSRDGTNWKMIHRVNGSGNSSSISNYTLFDNNPFNGTSYYRLKQTDYNGNSSYYPIKSISINNNTNNKIFPNPTNSKATIIEANSNINRIDVYNILGEKITSLVNITEQNEQKIIIDFSNLQSGIYYVRTNTNIYKIYKQ